MLETCFIFEPGYEELREAEFFESCPEIVILGRQYVSDKGGTGPTSDCGWGCMLRCGQMLLAQAMVMKHLGREWRWNSKQNNAAYAKILRMFQDKRSCLYSIHQIAQMGESEGKRIGEWFGPNTVMQVLRKLSVYDTWNDLAIHIAMNSAVVIEDVKLYCKSPLPAASPLPNSSISHLTPEQNKMNCVTNHSVQPRHASPKFAWRPLLLVIPLRLGLSHLNPCYVQSLKDCFSCHRFLGMIGGRPNHALYFIGVAGDKLIYMDPHDCQMSVDLDESDEELQDSSYHNSALLSMSIRSIDPSIALAFYCDTESEFDHFCSFAQQQLLVPECPLFEILEKHPATWPRFEPYAKIEDRSSDFTMLEEKCESDEDFELLS